jgi:L-lactate dehydrogenase complex protein LldG
MSAREEILGRIEDALGDVPADERPADVVVPRRYLRGATGAVVERFVERVSEYRADVRRVAGPELAATVAEICRERGIARLGVPADLPAAWIPEGIEALDAERLAPRELDTLGAALTGCALAIAETGTIVLDTGPLQGPRALSLVPDHHLCVVDEAQIVAGVPEAMDAIARAIREDRRPVTLVSGPSATSDIELDRVEGVHGPRDLVVLVASLPQGARSEKLDA